MFPFSDLQPASFRGVEFWVRSDKEAYGRRIVTHEYPLRDDPYHEDLGEKAQAFSVTGYVWGDSAIALKEAVVAAARAPGSALLQLPAKPAFLAVCKTLAVSRSKDEQGYFELAFEFIADPGAGMMPAMASAFESLIAGVATDIVLGLSTSFSNRFSAANALPYVMNNAMARIATFSALVLDTFESAALATSDPAVRVITAAIGLAQNAAAIVRPGPSDPASSASVETLAAMFTDMGQALDPNAALPFFKGFTTFAPLEPVDADGQAQYGLEASLVAPSELRDWQNAAAFNGSVRALALVALAQATAAATFTNRADALQARADLVELFGMEIERTVDEAISEALLNARDYAVQALSAQILNLAPVVTVESPASLPSLYWASRLYDDATRAQELSDRNKVPTPAYMPTQFEALIS